MSYWAFHPGSSLQNIQLYLNKKLCQKYYRISNLFPWNPFRVCHFIHFTSYRNSVQTFSLESILNCIGPGCTTLVSQRVASRVPTSARPHLSLVPVHLILITQSYLHAPILFHHGKRLFAIAQYYYENRTKWNQKERKPKGKKSARCSKEAVMLIWSKVCFFMVLQHIPIF